MSLFNQSSKGISRKDLRLDLKKEGIKNPFISGAQGKSLEKKLFPEKMGGFISEKDLSKELRELKKEGGQTGPVGRTEINREIKILKKLDK